MRSQTALFAFVAASFLGVTAHADNTANALDELKQGYTLKQSGKCAEAIPHFVASYRADSKPKALLNLADCEQQIGDLVAAQGHATQGRDLAHQLSDAELERVAAEQLDAIEKRIPRLTIRLASHAPEGATVSRDGASVGGASLGAPVATNPGRHVIAVNGPGFAEKRYELTLSEGSRQEIEVELGAEVPSRSNPTQRTTESAVWAPARRDGGMQTLGFLVGGVGVVGVAIGSAFGLMTLSQNATANDHCKFPGGKCDPTGVEAGSAAHLDGVISTIAFGVGLVAIAAGTYLILAPKPPSPAAAKVHVVPVVGPTCAGLQLAGRW